MMGRTVIWCGLVLHVILTAAMTTPSPTTTNTTTTTTATTTTTTITTSTTVNSVNYTSQQTEKAALQGREPRWVTDSPAQVRTPSELPSTLPPYPGNYTLTNITGQLGGSAFLPCNSRYLLEHQISGDVSWIRRRDFHILTSGSLTYTKEGRFQVHHQDGSTQWTLAIKYLQINDTGIYECHISTSLGILAQLVSLNVLEPRAVIQGDGEHHVQAGSTITLVCYIEQSPEPPQYIFWYHNSRMINYDRERGGVSVEMEEGQRVKTKLTLSNATPVDTGNYTCDAANTKPASITVYVTHDNQIAAIQPRAVNGIDNVKVSIALLALALMLALLGRPPGSLH